MDVLQAVFLGVLQGVAEFLPISSSGHLALAEYLLGLDEVPLLFDVLLHIATLAVVVVVFRDIIIRLFSVLFRFIVRRADRPGDAADLRLIVIILIATFLTAAIGLGLESLGANRFPKIIGGLLITTGVILFATRFFSGSRGVEQLNLLDGVFIGVAQGIGVLPGISRSGITIATALGRKINRKLAGDISFVVSIPAILGALLLELRHFSELAGGIGALPVAAGMAAAAVSGFIALKVLLKLIEGGKFFWFAVYLVPVGIAALVLL